METFNVCSGDGWDAENDREGFRHKVTAFGRRLGAELLGGSLYEMPDNKKVGIWSQSEGYQAMLRDEPKLDYWEGEN